MPRKKAAVNFEQIIEELEEARQIAIRNESPTAAISASLGKAKVLALMNDKKASSSLSAENYRQILVEFVGSDKSYPQI